MQDESSIRDVSRSARSIAAARFFAAASGLVARTINRNDGAAARSPEAPVPVAAAATAPEVRDPTLPAVGGGGGRPPTTNDASGRMAVAEPSRPIKEATAGRSGRLRRIVYFVVFFLIPALLGTAYYTFFAADRFATEIRFAIKASDSKQSDVLGMLTGLPNAGGAGGVQESYLVVTYLASREAVEELDREIGLRKLYAAPHGDFLSRLSSDATLDDLVDYWGHRISTAVDLQSNSVSFEVQAFTAEDAKRIADALLAMAEKLINSINERAHADAVRFADEQVARAETRLDANRRALREFRDWQANLDPNKTADTALATMTTLNNERLQLEQELAQRRRVLQPNSPTILDLTSRIAKVKEQIETIRSTVTQREGQTDKQALSDQVGRFEQLQAEQEFARKLYENALGSLEQARATANKQQLFIVPFVRASLAERARYPDRPVAILTVLVAAFGLWLTAILVRLAIRDHVI